MNSLADPELEALPIPRRPWRRMTLLALFLVTLSALLLGFALRHELAYALRDGEVTDLGDLVSAELTQAHANAWVRGNASLEVQALAYRRPLDQSQYRLTAIVGNPKLWVAFRIPPDFDAAHFIPPASFVGRLVPLGSVGLGYQALSQAELSVRIPADAWLLLDGESPQATRWVFGVLLLLAGFAGFGVWGMANILKRVH